MTKRQKIAIFITIAGICIANAITYICIIPISISFLIKKNDSYYQNNQITFYKNKLKTIHTDYKEKCIIGYYSGLPQSENFIIPTEGNKFYNLQYAITPIILENNLNHKVIIVNSAIKNIKIPFNYEVIKDYGNGIMLIKRTDK